MCDSLRWEVIAVGRHSHYAKDGTSKCDVMSSCQSALSHMQILVLVHHKFLHLVQYVPATPHYDETSPLSSLFSHTTHPKLFPLSKQFHTVCVGHSFDRQTKPLLASLHRLNGVITVCLPSSDILLSFFVVCTI